MKKNKWLLFAAMGLMCMTSANLSVNQAKAETTDLIIFENGAFYSEVSMHKAGSDITDGKWHNNAQWNASRVYLTDFIDLSKCETIELTYTNVGTATWVQFGIGTATNNDEYDYVELGKSFISDGEEHIYTYNFSEFLTTNIKCSWNSAHEDTHLNATNINAFSINAGNVTINVSKIVAKVIVPEITPVEINILKDGTFYSDIQNITKAVFENGVLKNSKEYYHDRILFTKTLDFTYYETIEFTYTASGTWNTAPEIGLGTALPYNEFDFVPIAQKVVLSDKEQVLTIQIKDYLNTNVSCSWGGTHEKKLDVTAISGLSIKFGSSEMCITKIVAKSNFLSFVKKVQEFNLCAADAAEIETLVNEYNQLLLDNASIANYKIDENTLLSERMAYATYLMTTKLNATTNQTGLNRALNLTNSNAWLIFIVAGIGLLSIVGYYLTMKKKLN